jgi:hypothetical protein
MFSKLQIFINQKKNIPIMDTIKKGIDIVAGANAALVYKKTHPLASEEEIMNHVISFSKNKQFKKSQMEIVVGASHAIKLTARNPRMSDRQVINQIMREMTTIRSSRE